MKTKASRIGLLLLLFLVVISSTTTQAASKKKKALKAYKKMLSQSTIEVIPPHYDEGEEYILYRNTKASKVKFAVIYLDNDNVPELLVTAKDTSYGTGRWARTIWSIFTYKNGKIVRIDNNWLYFSSLLDFKGYYKKTGVYKTRSDSDALSWDDCYNKYTGSETKIMCSHVYEYAESKEHTYYVNKGNKISKSTKSNFTAQKKKVTKSKKRIVPKMYANTSANRKKYLR